MHSDREKLVEKLRERAEYHSRKGADYGSTRPLSDNELKTAELLREAIAALATPTASAAQAAPGVTEAVRKALIFYENHGAGCRLIHSGGDASRNELAKDGGKRAGNALAALASPALAAEARASSLAAELAEIKKEAGR